MTATALVLPLSSTATASSDDTSSEQLQESVTLDGVMDHLEAFQEIADANGGNRASGLPGFDASSDYVADRMQSAGYDVEQREFIFDFFQQTADPEFEQ
ncbi:MAG: aminopeptidase, partial [Nocardioidaceae bacterium]